MNGVPGSLKISSEYISRDVMLSRADAQMAKVMVLSSPHPHVDIMLQLNPTAHHSPDVQYTLQPLPAPSLTTHSPRPDDNVTHM